MSTDSVAAFTLPGLAPVLVDRTVTYLSILEAKMRMLSIELLVYYRNRGS